MKRSPDERHTYTQKHNRNIFMITDVFFDQKRVNVYEYIVKMVPCVVTEMWARERKRVGVEGMDGKLS